MPLQNNIKNIPLIFIYLVCILGSFIACNNKADKGNQFYLEQRGNNVFVNHKDFTVVFPNRNKNGVIPIAMDDSTSFSISTIKNTYPFYHVFFRPDEKPASKWDDELARQKMAEMEKDGNYDAKFRQVEIQGSEAYEVAYVNYLLDTNTTPHKPVVQYTRELFFTRDSIAYWLEITTENSDLNDEQAAEFFGSLKFKN